MNIEINWAAFAKATNVEQQKAWLKIHSEFLKLRQELQAIHDGVRGAPNVASKPLCCISRQRRENQFVENRSPFATMRLQSQQSGATS